MPYKSGRTRDQGFSVSVLEGDKLYVHPRRFAAMKELEHSPECEHWHPDEMARALLRICALSEGAIKGREGRNTEIVVDYELADDLVFPPFPKS